MISSVRPFNVAMLNNDASGELDNWHPADAPDANERGGDRCPDSMLMTDHRKTPIELHWDLLIACPQDEVFAVLADFETYLPQWAKGPVAVERTTPGPTGLGTEMIVTARAAGIRVRSPYQITRWNPPDLLGGAGIAGPFRFDEEYQLSTSGDGTAVHYEIRATPRGPLRLIRGPLAKQLKKLIDGDLDRLKTLTESR